MNNMFNLAGVGSFDSKSFVFSGFDLSVLEYAIWRNILECNGGCEFKKRYVEYGRPYMGEFVVSVEGILRLFRLEDKDNDYLYNLLSNVGKKSVFFRDKDRFLDKIKWLFDLRWDGGDVKDKIFIKVDIVLLDFLLSCCRLRMILKTGVFSISFDGEFNLRSI